MEYWIHNGESHPEGPQHYARYLKLWGKLHRGCPTEKPFKTLKAAKNNAAKMNRELAMKGRHWLDGLPDEVPEVYWVIELRFGEPVKV